MRRLNLESKMQSSKRHARTQTARQISSEARIPVMLPYSTSLWLDLSAQRRITKVFDYIVEELSIGRNAVTEAKDTRHVGDSLLISRS